MPNGHAYEPVPIEQHDAAIVEERQRIAARSAIGAVKVAADLLGVTLAEMVGLMDRERQADRLFEALKNPTPAAEPDDVPVTVHRAAEHDSDECLACIRNGWAPTYALLDRSTGLDSSGVRWHRGD